MSIMAETPSSSGPSLPPPSDPKSQDLFRQPSSSSIKGKSPDHGSRSATATPQKSSLRSRPSKSSIPGSQDPEETAWGSNFWVTLVDPQTQTSFFACPATGQVSWDAPVGNFVLPPSADGEWWELSDDSRGGLPYYYQTKTGETVWERPEGFVIPLGIIQNSALGRRLSNRLSQSIPTNAASAVGNMAQTPEKYSYRRSQTYTNGQDSGEFQSRKPYSSQSPNKSPLQSGKKQNSAMRRSMSSEQYSNLSHGTSLRPHGLGQQLPPIPASPYGTDASAPATPASSRQSLNSQNSPPRSKSRPRVSNGSGKNTPSGRETPDSPSRARSKSSSYVSHRPPQPQSLSVAIELLTSSQSDSGVSVPKGTAESSKESSPGDDTENLSLKIPSTRLSHSTPPSPRRPIPAVPSIGNARSGRNVSAPNIAGKGISAPILNHAATLDMSPVKDRAAGKPIPVEPRIPLHRTPTTTMSTGTYPVLPQDLASDILQFSESDYAKQYFSKHSIGFIFKRRIPVAQLMAWQKAPLTSPLLTLNRSLHRDAVKVFKVIQHIMGDRERDRAVNVRMPADTHVSTVASINASTTSLSSSTSSILEEERWLLGEGITHGEIRDEIYCQVMKQLNKNPNPESVFKGWQLLCVMVITFPPSKNFETYLRSFMQKHTSIQEGRLDVMAKYCLRRLDFISKKGPRGKSPTTTEIETASDAAFNPSTFGESLDAIIRLQQRNYPQQMIPIILPFLADGILALGGTKSEGIFRVPGDSDSVSELKLRIDRGYYNLDGVDDPHILASLMKLWLRELCDPLIPEEMYNECVMNSKDPGACVHIVQRLPTINRRVVLFVISFLQLFLEEKVQSITKMTPANLALVMAPNLLRCSSDSTAIVFTNAQYEQIFVYNLLLHLKCGETDAEYAPVHGFGAVEPSPAPRKSKSRARPQNH